LSTPGMTLGPHDHCMWAAIGVYTGGEDNTFFREWNGPPYREQPFDMQRVLASFEEANTATSVLSPE
jgi:predicted metal-dependent enzyme (double-stranded beta helix superfamily)